MSRGYTSRRRAESLQAPQPGQSPATDAATVYAQRWKRADGTSVRAFDVLALDEGQAERFGQVRLMEKYRQMSSDWYLLDSRPLLRITSHVFAVLMAETPEERRLRDEACFDRRERAAS